MTFNEGDVLASICRESFFEFVVEFWDTIIDEEPIWNWHIKYLCDELQAVAERVFAGEPKAYDLIINIAPGSSKSTIVSQMFPAWCWSHFPAARFICASYAKDIALKDSIKCRDIIQSEKYAAAFPEIELRGDENKKGLFTNTKKGFRYSAGVGGAVTGYHGHFLIVDDPINPEEAFSDVELATANRWMTNTLTSRKVDKKISVTILIQQRLHQNDPTGDWIERTGGKGVKWLKLPGELPRGADGEIERDDDGELKYVSPEEVVQYYQDDLFDPIRMPRDVLRAMEKDMGAYGFAGQVLQHPVPLGGGDFKTDMIKIVANASQKIVRRIRSWDKAGTEDGGCYSVGALMGIDKDENYWILDIVRGQWAATERENQIVQTALLDGRGVEIELEIEGGSGGKESAEGTLKRLAGYRVRAAHPTGDKRTRAYEFASQVGGGFVRCLNRDWTKQLIDELRFFPNSRYKDQVDALSGAFNRLVKKKRVIGARRAVVHV